MNEYIIGLIGIVIGGIFGWGDKIITRKPAEKDASMRGVEAAMNGMEKIAKYAQEQKERAVQEKEAIAEDRDRLIERNTNLAKENKAIRQKLCECEQRNEQLRGGE